MEADRVMRILMVEASGRGFLCHYAHALSLGLHEAGHEVSLITGLRDELVDWSAPFEKSSCLVDGWRGWRCLQQKVEEKRPQVVHLQWVNNPLPALFFVRWSKKRGIRVVYTPHNILPHRGRWVNMPAYRLLYRLIDRIVARDSHIAWGLEEIFDTPRRKVAFLPGSPNLLAHPSLSLSSACADQCGLPEVTPGEFRLLFFGHGCGRKGLDLLLRALVEKEWPGHLHLVIAGEEVLRGVDETMLERVKQRITTTVLDGYVPPVQVSTLMRGSDLMLMPYVKLCKSPLTDMAAAFNLPVLRSDRVKGAVFTEGLHGVTIPHDDAGALQRKIRFFADHPEKIRAMRIALQQEETVEESIMRLAMEHGRMYSQLFEVAGKRLNKPHLRLVKT